MEYIIDTHVLLWSMFEPHKLSQTVKKILTNKNINRFMSIASMWEIAIKHRIGKLPLSMEMSDYFSVVKSANIGLYSINQHHIEAYSSLPLNHRDPFDGIIIATALSEQMTIITADENIQKYEVPWVW